MVDYRNPQIYGFLTFTKEQRCFARIAVYFSQLFASHISKAKYHFGIYPRMIVPASQTSLVYSLTNYFQGFSKHTFRPIKPALFFKASQHKTGILTTKTKAVGQHRIYLLRTKLVGYVV